MVQSFLLKFVSTIYNYYISAPPVNGSWSLPVMVSPCTATCGSGTKQVLLTCNNPPPSGGGLPCGQNFTEIHAVACNLDPCPGYYLFCFKFQLIEWEDVVLYSKFATYSTQTTLPTTPLTPLRGTQRVCRHFLLNLNRADLINLDYWSL